MAEYGARRLAESLKWLVKVSLQVDWCQTLRIKKHAYFIMRILFFLPSVYNPENHEDRFTLWSLFLPVRSIIC